MDNLSQVISSSNLEDNPLNGKYASFKIGSISSKTHDDYRWKITEVDKNVNEIKMVYNGKISYADMDDIDFRRTIL
jgi:hypothetical protein